jgi:hypothetical protein
LYCHEKVALSYCFTVSVNHESLSYAKSAASMRSRLHTYFVSVMTGEMF